MERELLPEELQLIKKVEYSILKEIKKVCDRHGLQFFMIGGTLLGAIRHHGMIPWDDDIDIALLRKDYDKFVKYASIEMPAFIKVVNFHTSPGMGEPFTKVMDMRGRMVEIFSSTSNAPKGIFVDVFPVDHVPDSYVKRTAHRFLNYSLRKLILLDADYNFSKKGLKKLVYSGLKKFAKLIGRQKLIEAYEKNAVKYENIPCANLVVLASNYGYEIENVDTQAMASTFLVQFEDGEFPVPIGYEQYLQNVYGDYMKLPPPEKRVNKHKLCELDLSSFE